MLYSNSILSPHNLNLLQFSNVRTHYMCCSDLRLHASRLHVVIRVECMPTQPWCPYTSMCKLTMPSMCLTPAMAPACPVSNAQLEFSKSKPAHIPTHSILSQHQPKGFTPWAATIYMHRLLL